MKTKSPPFSRNVLVFIGVCALGLILGVVLGYASLKSTDTAETKAITSQNYWQPKDPESEIARMPALVQQGYYLISETSKNIGPMALDSTKRHAGNNLACANCHLKAGTQAGASSWVGIIERFPQFGGRANKIGSIEDRINGCIERSLNGKTLPLASSELKAIVAYMDWLGEGIPANKKEEFKGYVPITLPDTAVDLVKGKMVYDAECMLCHKENGQGVRHLDKSKGYEYPPLWGPDSYNTGAGMHRVITAAAFIKSNMPFGQATWDKPKLTDEEAYHVAGYINSFDRPKKKNTAADFPDKKLKPVSTPYAPWADKFSAEQHKNGPFKPIIAHYKKEYDIVKTK